MIDYVDLGPVPIEEDCIQVGQENYFALSKKECSIYKDQLERMFSERPNGTWFSVQSFPHDFGSYHEVVLKYNDTFSDCVEFAGKVEDEIPSYWDEEALEELKRNGFSPSKDLVRE